MARGKKTGKASKTVTALTHDEDKRVNIPTAELQPVVDAAQRAPLPVEYGLRNPDLDPQLIWRGKYDCDSLVVPAPPLYIQEKIHPEALIQDLLRCAEADNKNIDLQLDLFADFNGIAPGLDKTAFYQHDQNWSNRMILGDSLQVMASLAEREGLRGKVQCIYFDPPYGIKFNSNFQWSTTSRDVKDGKPEHITREPEQVKAFRDTWRDGIHSYLSYLRDRLIVARDLLTDSGSIFVQIGDENVHRVRAVMDEVFGEDNFVAILAIKTTTGRGGTLISEALNYVLWAAKTKEKVKYQGLLLDKSSGVSTAQVYTLLRFPNGELRRMTPQERDGQTTIPKDAQIAQSADITSTRPSGENDLKNFEFEGQSYNPGKRTFTTERMGMTRLSKGGRLWATSTGSLRYLRHINDFPAIPMTNIWSDVGTGSFTEDKVYVVQTNTLVVQRCLLMTTDPGDLVLDPTCGSGTTAYVAEQWGRRWITIDTSRVALALARARIMGARYPYYLLADSPEGKQKEFELRGLPSRDREGAVSAASVNQPLADAHGSAAHGSAAHGNLRHGFVYERVPHITLKSIANNAEIDVIWDKYEQELAPLRAKLTTLLPAKWLDNYRAGQRYTAPVPPEIQEWEIPRQAPADWPAETHPLVADFWSKRIARQQEIDASIAAKAESEYLYDKPYVDKSIVRTAGPFTVESISPHRALTVGPDDELIDPLDAPGVKGQGSDFVSVMLDNLKAAGVQQAHKEDKLDFTELTPWPGRYLCAEGRYQEGETEKRAGIFIGPEFGTVRREDLTAAAREAAEAGFDVVVACAFSYDAHCADFGNLGKVQVLKARMNADLHMAGDLKATGKGNLFVIFGEPDVEILTEPDGRLRVRINGVDVFKPQTGEVVSKGPDDIACWMVDTNYNEESFFVRHAYFLGQNDPYAALKTTLKAEINADIWATLHSDISRPFDKPASGRIAVKVINHLGDEVMKVLRV